MKPIRLLLITILLLASKDSIAQQEASFTPKIISPSPNAISIMKFGDIPVSYYTGTPNISAPLYSVSEGKLKVPISLNYHPSGIRVAEEAGQVGLGWALNTGGLISRTIIGEDDFIAGRYFSATNNIPQNWSYFNLVQVGGVSSADNSNVIFNFKTPANQTVTLDLKASTGTATEYEPDMFSFSFPGGGGKFAITRDKKILMAEKSDIKITMIEGNTNNEFGENISWEVVTTDGTKYMFDEKERYYIPSSGSSARHVSSWYLKSITSHTGDVITFSYNQMTNGKNYPQGSVSETRFVSIIGNAPCADGLSFAPFRTSPQYTETVTLDRITFSTGYVKFNYGSREDLYWDKKLENIEVHRNEAGTNSLLKTYALEYGYFVGDQDPENILSTGEGSISKRLKLLSITEKAPTGEVVVPYRFTYFEGDNNTNLPAKTSFAIDHWGYYNGNLSNNSLIPTFNSAYPSTDNILRAYGIMTGTERNTNPNYIKAFSLKKIAYATGGYSQFDFEAHEYDIAKSMQKDQSVSRNVPMVEKYDAPYFIYEMNNKGNIQSFTLDLTGAVSNGAGTIINVNAFAQFQQAIPCGAVSTSNKLTFELYNSANALVGHYDMFTMPACNGSNSPCVERNCPTMASIRHNSDFPPLTPGIYTCKLYGADVMGGDYVLSGFRVGFSWYKNVSLVPGAKGYAGGMRVKEIIDFDGEKQTIKKFEYSLIEREGNLDITKSSGRLMTMPQYSYLEELSCINGANVPSVFKRILRTSNSIIALNTSASGNVVGYDKVTVIYGSNGENGKSAYYYDNQSDFVANYGYYRPPTISSMPYNGNGLLLKKQDFKSDGFLIKETVNTYFVGPMFSSPPSSQFLYGVEKRMYPTPSGLGYLPLHGFFYPAISKSVVYLEKSIERVFDTTDPQNARKVETVTNYNYLKEVYLPESNSFSKTYMQPNFVTKVNSKGQTVKTEYKYTYDYASGTYINMTNLNIVGTAIEEKVSIYDNQISKKLTNFKLFNSFYAPENIQTQLAATHPLVTEVTFDSYDNNGNITKYTGRDGIANYFEYYGPADAGKVNLLKKSTLGTGGIAQSKLFDYEPLKGIKSVVEPTGYTTYYKYDGLGRLLEIKDNDNKLLKSYKYNYQTPDASTVAASGQQVATVNFTGQLDVRSKEIALAFSCSNTDVARYEIRRGYGNEPLKHWVTVSGKTRSKIDPTYTPQKSTYKYEIRGILNQGVATDWKALNITLPANCNNNFQIIKNGLVSAGQAKSDKACYEVIFEEGFITADNAEYTAEIETP